jgi:predicted Zn-dependent peptidase
MVLTTWLMGFAGFPSFAQDLAEFEKKVTEFTLDNGLKFIVVERREAPVVSFMTYADVGSVDEKKGITGLAHLFEHLAFKGTTTVGATNHEAEKAAFEKMDQLFLEIKSERRKGERADKARLEELQMQFEEHQKEAEKYIVPHEFDEAIAKAGGVGLNADTAWDRTRYYYSLPSNKLELWMCLESDRFLNPVLREFYKERDVVAEERRLSENNPISRLVEDFFATAFKAHPYGEPVIGHMSDIQTITRQEAEAFFDQYYRASNLTIAIVGDVDPKQVREFAETYFGRLPKGEKPEPVETIEPEQQGERRCSIVAQSQPIVIIGYHRPGINHPDNAGFDAITDILGVGRTSRLYKSMVRDQKIAIAAEALSITGAMIKYPNLFIFLSVPAKGHTNEENEQALYAEIEKLKTELVTPEELEKAKTRTRADLIRQLDSNSGLAAQLAFYEAVTFDWRNLFHQLDQIDQVTAEDIRRVANTYFTNKNKTVGTIVTEEE